MAGTWSTSQRPGASLGGKKGQGGKQVWEGRGEGGTRVPFKHGRVSDTRFSAGACLALALASGKVPSVPCQRVPNGGCRALGRAVGGWGLVGLGAARWVASGGRDGRTSKSSSKVTSVLRSSPGHRYSQCHTFPTFVSFNIPHQLIPLFIQRSRHSPQSLFPKPTKFKSRAIPTSPPSRGGVAAQ